MSSGVKSIDLVVQGLPPAHDAIGEYTGYLACELSQLHEVRVLTSRDQQIDALYDVEIDACFTLKGSRRFDGLLQSLTKTKSDAVVLQYNPFAWGHRGWAPDLVNVFRAFKSLRPDVVLAVMFHETFMMNPGFKSWIMRQYQRRQFRALNELVDVAFYSTELWATERRQRDPKGIVVHLPVGANLPRSQNNPLQVRRQWGIEECDIVCGVFGGAHPSKMFPWIEVAANRIGADKDSERRVVLLHVGGERLAWSRVSVPIVRTGRLPADQAADAIAVMDLMISPFTDGVSTRRGSVMAALQHGVPVLTTSGHATDSVWYEQNHNAIFLAPSTDQQAWINAIDVATRSIRNVHSNKRENICQFYETNFSWKVIAESVGQHLLLAWTNR